MLSIFPHLFTWSLVSPLLIRLTLGGVFLHWSYKGLKESKGKPKSKILGIVGGIAGILLVIGLYTQLAAIVAILILGFCTIKKMREGKFFTDGVNYYFLLLVMAVSLLFTGAGFWAFDLPL